MSFEDAFNFHFMPAILLETGASQQSAYRTMAGQFVEWFKNNHRLNRPMVADLDQEPRLLADFYAFLLTQGSERSANKKLVLLNKVWKDLSAMGLVVKSPSRPRTKQIRKKAGVEKVQHIPMPVIDTELDACLRAILDLHDDLTFPRFGKMEPFQFWFNAIAACAVHGIRPAEFWPLEKRHGIGLEWTEICLSASPPIANGEKLNVEWEFGWLDLRMNKTGGKLRTPISPHLRFMIEQCRGLDPVRVFPMPYSSDRWAASLDMILSRAGFQKQKLQKDDQKLRWPVSLCGSSPQASLRKTASVLWRRHGSAKLASFMLGHSSRSGTSADVDGGSEVTDEHYSGSETFREVIDAYPRVLRALPELIRC